MYHHIMHGFLTLHSWISYVRMALLHHGSSITAFLSSVLKYLLIVVRIRLTIAHAYSFGINPLYCIIHSHRGINLTRFIR